MIQKQRYEMGMKEVKIVKNYSWVHKNKIDSVNEPLGYVFINDKLIDEYKILPIGINKEEIQKAQLNGESLYHFTVGIEIDNEGRRSACIIQLFHTTDVLEDDEVLRHMVCNLFRDCMEGGSKQYPKALTSKTSFRVHGGIGTKIDSTSLKTLEEQIELLAVKDIIQYHTEKKKAIQK
jgi:hypothetical protein